MIQPPDYAALINLNTCSAFAMRYVGRKDLVQSLFVGTGTPERAGHEPLSAVMFDEAVQLVSDDSLMFIAPFVRLLTPVPADYAGRLLMARLTVVIDGQTVVDKELLDRYLVAPPCKAVPQEGRGEQLVYVGREEDVLLGCCRLHFLADKWRILIRLDGIPEGGGGLRFASGAVLGHYTMKPREGSLYDVGALDAAQQAYPISCQWSEPGPRSGGPLTQDKIERAYSNELRAVLEQKEAEIRRLQGEAEVYLRAKADERDLELRRLKEEAELRAKAEQKELELRRLQEDAALRAKAEQRRAVDRLMKEVSAPAEPEPGAHIDQALERARRRLIRWGGFAILTVLGAALFLLLVSRYGGMR